MKEPKEKVASIVRYKGNRDKLIHWLSSLPLKDSVYELKKLLENVREGHIILWTAEHGVRIL
jgi:hypothetical protein